MASEVTVQGQWALLMESQRTVEDEEAVVVVVVERLLRAFSPRGLKVELLLELLVPPLASWDVRELVVWVLLALSSQVEDPLV